MIGHLLNGRLQEWLQLEDAAQSSLFLFQDPLVGQIDDLANQGQVIPIEMACILPAIRGFVELGKHDAVADAVLSFVPPDCSADSPETYRLNRLI